jgi:pyridoxamine 5'-phosphate oxidase
MNQDNPTNWKTFESPYPLFESIFGEAKALYTFSPGTNYNAMVLSTVNSEGQPASRVVLLKGVENGSFQFFTNYDSSKSKDLSQNNKAAVLFYWEPMGIQIRVQGKVDRLSRDQSVSYWNSRPRESQLSGYTSPQSKPIESYGWLERTLEMTDAKFNNQPIPCPESWGGFGLTPTLFEFWKLGDHRLHFRLRYRKSENGDGSKWEQEILGP